jgi:hypothetical protein
MRRKLLLVPSLMLLCLVLIPDRAPEVRSQQSTPPVAEYVDDGVSLPSEANLAKLAQTDAPAFLEMCMRRYRREVHTLSGEMIKQERIDGKVTPPELIDFWFREEPYSVMIKWKKGARQAAASMYVKGENNDKLLALPSLLKWAGKVVERDPDGREARACGRYTIKESSILQGTERTWAAWKAAKEKGNLQVEYLGVVPVAELAGRSCHVLKRICDPPAEDGIVTVEIAVDAETWLQTGSTLTDGKGELVGKYLFPKVVINPDLPANQFTKETLRK